MGKCDFLTFIHVFFINKRWEFNETFNTKYQIHDNYLSLLKLTVYKLWGYQEIEY